MRQLLSNENSETFFFRQIFLQKLPPGIQQIFAVKCSLVASLHQLVEKGDRAYEIHSNYQTISAISKPQVPVHSAAPFSSQSMEDRLTLMERVKRMSCARKFNAYVVQSATEAEKTSEILSQTPTNDTCFYHVDVVTAARRCQLTCKFS